MGPAVDLLIQGGTIVDGSGKKAFEGDVVVKDGKIVQVGRDLAGKVDANETIDAHGKLVCPGWVDVHTHLDSQMSWDPLLFPFTANGVTTVVMGNCGVGFSPAKKDQRQFLLELMEGVEDVPLGALEVGIDWQWESFPEFMDYMESRQFGADVGVLVAHGPIRAWVLGERANLSDRPGGPKNDPVTSEEMETMAEIVREAIANGAVGFSTSRTLLHRDRSGTLVPGTLAADEELLMIGEAMKMGGGGVFEMASDFMSFDDTPHTPENHGTRLEHFAREWVWMNKISAGFRVPVCFCIAIPSSETLMRYSHRSMLSEAMSSRNNGSEMSVQVLTRPQGILMSWESKSHAFVDTPTYLELRREALRTRKPIDKNKLINDREIRAKILRETRELSAKAESNAAFGISLPQGLDTDEDILAGNLNGSVNGPGALAKMLQEGAGFTFRWDKSYEPTWDQSVQAEANAKGVDAFEVLYDWMCEKEGNAVISFFFMNYSGHSLDFTHEMLTCPVSVPGLADAGAHGSFLCDSTAHTFLLTHWVRDKKNDPKLSLEEAVKIQTHDTAHMIGFRDRGLIAPEMKADINVIDFERLEIHEPVLVSDLPKGASRWIQTCSGYVVTICNGIVTHRDGKPTGALPGRLVRNQGTFATEGSDLALKLGLKNLPKARADTTLGRLSLAWTNMKWESKSQLIKLLSKTVGAGNLESFGLVMQSFSKL